jgi:hypothetical protein
MALAVAPAANGKTRTKPFSAGDETTVKQRPLNGRCVRGRLMGISNVELAIAFFVTFSATIFLGHALEARLR